MRPKKDIAADQMDMALYRKGGRARRYAEGGDIESSADYYAAEGKKSDDRPISFKEAFKANRAIGNKTFEWRGKQYTTELDPAKKATPSDSKPAAPIRDEGVVPVGEDERVSRQDSRPQARQPSTAERMLEALPVTGAGIAGGAALGRMASRAINARRAVEAAEAAKARSVAALRKSTEARAATRAAAKEAESGKAEAFVGRRNPKDGYRSGGVVSASRRADGCAQRGKTKGRVI